MGSQPTDKLKNNENSVTVFNRSRNIPKECDTTSNQKDFNYSYEIISIFTQLSMFLTEIDE
jgi:hypothetical protein